MPIGLSRFTTSRDGLQLHSRDYGSDLSPEIPVVCLPGLSRTAEDFEVLAQALATGGRRVVALDYRGRGLSDWDPQPKNYDLRVESNDIVDVLTAIGITRAIFVGTSRGGLHVMLLGALRPAFLAAAVLNDVGPVIAAAGLRRIKGYIGKMPALKTWDDAVSALRHIADGSFTGLSEADWMAYARLTFRDDNGTPRSRYDPGLMENLKLVDVEAIPELWPQFDGLSHIPLLVIRGENSDLLTAETAQEMVRRRPDCALYVVPGQGHAPLLMDQPTIDRIATFVATVDISAPSPLPLVGA